MAKYNPLNSVIAKPTGCWEHRGRDLKFSVSRRVWDLVTNKPVPEGCGVFRRCFTDWCCNPAHLYLTTKKEHMVAKYSAWYPKHIPVKVSKIKDLQDLLDKIGDITS